jgi:hypothetical protein
MTMRRFCAYLGSVAILLLIAGCWVPERFEAKVTVHRDGTYSFVYNGTLAHVLVALAIKKGEAIPEKIHTDLKAQVAATAQSPGFRSATYVGDGRVKVLFEQKFKADESYHFPSQLNKALSIVPQGDGTLRIEAAASDANSVKRLNEIGLKYDGTLTVATERGVEMVKHNAQSEPKLFGLIGSYGWKITAPDQQPLMIVRWRK